VPVSDPWFEVYRFAPSVFAIYEPHQSEETISYLIVGDNRAMLFDTGMGISDIRKVTAEEHGTTGPTPPASGNKVLFPRSPQCTGRALYGHLALELVSEGGLPNA
jgi:hypothetical protein